MLLSITIPTYNRAKYLQRCLLSVLPQVQEYNDVEVLVIDNASPDNTREIVEQFTKQYPSLRYIRNTENLGYAGNQAKCIELAQGRYAAILCDDDLYRSDALETIHPILLQDEYAFVAINYYGLKNASSETPFKPVTPEVDQFSDDAYKIFEVPGVGHFSGLILNVNLAREALKKLLANNSLSVYEKQRGILHDIVIISTRSSTLPGYFIGKAIMGAGAPEEIDYDSLRHICFDTYKLYLRAFNNGYISEKEFEFRKHHIITWLPKALLINGGFIKREEIFTIESQLNSWFTSDKTYNLKCLPLLKILRYTTGRFLLRNLILISLYMKGFSKRKMGLHMFSNK